MDICFQPPVRLSSTLINAGSLPSFLDFSNGSPLHFKAQVAVQMQMMVLMNDAGSHLGMREK